MRLMLSVLLTLAGWFGAATAMAQDARREGEYKKDGAPAAASMKTTKVEKGAGEAGNGTVRQVHGVGETFRDCPDVCPEMIVVPAGSFTMGSPANETGRSLREDQVQVTIPAPFAAGKFAITFDEWDACVAAGGCDGYVPADEGWGRGKHPVINVKWDDVESYIAWLSSKTGKTYRLLSETEREYLTRAGTATPFWWGASITTAQANYHGRYSYAGGPKGEFRKHTVPVDSFEPNPWGFYNVHGNVWEWTEDCWNEDNAGNPGDGGVRTSGDCSSRVLRGGSWLNNPIALRSANRNWDATVNRNIDAGFRVARSLAP